MGLVCGLSATASIWGGKPPQRHPLKAKAFWRLWLPFHPLHSSRSADVVIVIDANGINGFPVLLSIFADNDANKTGEIAAYECPGALAKSRRRSRDPDTSKCRGGHCRHHTYNPDLAASKLLVLPPRGNGAASGPTDRPTSSPARRRRPTSARFGHHRYPHGCLCRPRNRPQSNHSIRETAPASGDQGQVFGCNPGASKQCRHGHRLRHLGIDRLAQQGPLAALHALAHDREGRGD